jgi:S1-C subfamily serine protease
MQRSIPETPAAPLLDSAGRLIGVNAQIHSPSGASADIGFAIQSIPSIGLCQS